jgi:hypothetical protein
MTMTHAAPRFAFRSLSAALCMGAALGACSTMGTGSGMVAASGAPVRFTWHATDPANGTLSATLADGREFTGTFHQLVPRGYLGTWVKFPKDYEDNHSNRVTARLRAADGERMGCLFHLHNTVGGIVEGATGECRFGDNSIEAVLPRALPRGV